jgi:tripartite-type tricarboxylate transporter receptor subunit TctC
MSVRSILTLVLVAACIAPPLRAQTAEDFYRGKTIKLIVGHPAGGDYDAGARLLARYLPGRIPGTPTIVVENMPAASSIAAANYLYAGAPKDGTVFGSFSRNLPSQAVLGDANIKADPRRYNWLGATSLPSRVCIARTDAPVKTVADLFTHELITAGSGPGSSLSIVPTVVNHVLGTKFKLVQGYQGTTDGILAVERGEVEGICNSLAQFAGRSALFSEGKVRFLFHAEEAPLGDHPDVPSIYDYAKQESQKQLMRFVFSSVEFGRPYVMPPDVPPARVAIMRKAFAEAVQDPALIAEAGKLKLDMTYRSPDALATLVTKLYETPKDMIDTVQKLVPAGHE